ncbi:MAG: threonylcarbamoyl-AMP synthase [Candidatus Hydrogenedentes bacterium]|nr:threonylcarbamoyl-AMP synthase [Candidatus Hydrogenedentota bacterium]
MRLLPPTPEGLAIAAAAVRRDEVVAYPTDTVYGLGVNPFSEEAVRRLFAAKQRDAGKPVMLIVADEAQLFQVVSHVSSIARTFIQAFWPGPLSLLFPKSQRLPHSLTAGSDKVCVRCPASRIARDLCLAAGTPLTSSSANLSGDPPVRSLKALDLLGVAAGIDAGFLEESEASTVFDPAHVAVLRKGAVAEAELRATLEW